MMLGMGHLTHIKHTDIAPLKEVPVWKTGGTFTPALVLQCLTLLLSCHITKLNTSFKPHLTTF